MADRALRAGDHIAGYRIDAVLGRGGMGVVYLATHEQLERKAAVKVLIPELSEDADFRARFIRESKLAASLEHPNVIPIYDAAEVEGVLFIAMRYVEGEDLKQRLKREGSLSPERTLETVSQVAGALDAAHAKGLVHRDVKPANILIEQGTGQAYLSDFGVAKSQGQTGFTRTGSFLGSVDYCPPEQIEGRPLDGRADIYGLGCVLFHCLSGQPPYVRETEIAVINAHLNDPIPALSTVAPGFPRALDGVIVTAMAKHPEVRFRTAGELAGAMRAAMSGGAPELSTAATIPVPSSASTVAAPAATMSLPQSPARVERTSRRRWMIAGAVAAFILVVGLGGLVLLSGGEESSAGAQETSTTQPPAPSIFSADLSHELTAVVAPQEAVSTLVADLRPTRESFSELRSAASRLERVAIKAEGSVMALDAGTTAEKATRRDALTALRRQSVYAGALAALPQLSGFTKARARAIIAKADRTEAAYTAVSRGAEPPCCPKMPVRAGAARHLLSVTGSASSEAATRAFVGRIQSLLSESVRGRDELVTTLGRLYDCQIYPSGAISGLESVIANRESLLQQLSTVPTPTYRTQQVAARLQRALTHSLAADRYYRDWVSYLALVDPADCGTLRTTDYDLARGEDAQASSAKSAFVSAFNPMARQFRTRTWSITQF